MDRQIAENKAKVEEDNRRKHAEQEARRATFKSQVCAYTIIIKPINLT